MPTLLITGGAGFIGGRTASLAIEQGWSVRVLDNLSTGLQSTCTSLKNQGADVMVGDIRDPETVDSAVKGCDAVVHLAAQVSVPYSVDHSEENHAINVGGTACLLKACQDNDVSRFIMASSAAVYGSCENLPLREEDAGAFQSPYAESKHTNEGMMKEARQEGMETIALRFFNVYGTGQRTAGAYAAVVPKFIELATQGNAPIIHGDGHQTRDFIHVDDVVEAVLMLAGEKWNPAYAPVYNLSTGIEVSLLQLVKNIQGVLREISPTTNRPAPVHTDGRVGDILRSVGSSARIQNDTAWKPRISLESGIRRQIEDALNRT